MGRADQERCISPRCDNDFYFWRLICLIPKTALPTVDRKHPRMLPCRQTPGRGRPVLVRSLLLLVRHGGLLPACRGERGPATAAAAAPAASWRSNAAKFTAGAAKQLPCVPSPERPGFAAESH